MDKQQLKNQVCAQIDRERDGILRLGRAIYSYPETGYREHRTAATLVEAFTGLGLRVEKDIAVTGFRCFANEGKAGPKVAVLGELDSVICNDHPDRDLQTGAAHACGHHCQTTVMYAVAAALKNAGVLEQLDGRVDFIGTPSEEYIELDFREELRREGRLEYLSGKQEMAYRGVFDDVDMAMMVHNFPIAAEGFKMGTRNTGTGFVAKTVQFIGRLAHAGAAPWDGVNALNMATLAISAMHMQRETFRDVDAVRVHQIITKGGDIVNSVPEDVRAETFVRAMNLEALRSANSKVNRSVEAATVALGGRAVVTEAAGYLPLKADPMMARLFGENAARFYDPAAIVEEVVSTASFDIGDLSHFMPVLHGCASGIEGGLHTRDFRVVDEDDAFIIPAKVLACTVVDLLADGAGVAQEVRRGFRPIMTREAYLRYLMDAQRTIEYGSL